MKITNLTIKLGMKEMFHLTIYSTHLFTVIKHQTCSKEPMPWTESLIMAEAVPMSRYVRNLKVYGHVNKVSQFPK